MTFETRDKSELRAHLRRLREERADGPTIRIGTLCGRLEQRTTYRLSRFTADLASRSDHPHDSRAGSDETVPVEAKRTVENTPLLPARAGTVPAGH